ncbi:MAG: PEP-CTERM sorting domain-containing protein [Armatimonadota bacterium]
MSILRVALIGMLCFVLVGSASAYLLDEHFGVSLQLDPDNSATDTYRDVETIPMLGSSYAPTKNTDTVDYIVDDWFGSWSDTDVEQRSDLGATGLEPSGGEPYDVEALYFDDDYDNLYFCVITSFDPAPGYTETRSGFNNLVVSGDLAIDLGLNTPYDDGFSYDYGVNLNHENRQTSGDATSGGTTVGTDFYRTANSDWYTGSPTLAVEGQGELTNFDPDYSGGFSGSFLDDVTTDYYAYDFGTDQETLYSTYIIEVTVPKSILPELHTGDTVGMSWVEGCRNDATGTNGIIRFDDPPDIDTPEPGTLVLTTLGLAAIGVLRRRRKDDE